MAISRDSFKTTSTAAAYSNEPDNSGAAVIHSAISEVEKSTHEFLVFLDPNLVQIPDTPNRLPESFEDEAFEALKIAIMSGGKNVEPIEVRRKWRADVGFVDELIFGERRLRACRAANLKVRAVVRDGDDVASDYLDRMRENAGRTDLSPAEFALQVKYMIDGPAQMKKIELSSKLGISLATISRAYDLACLPPEVMKAFVSAREVRYKDLKILKDAWAKDPEAVAAESERIQGESERIAGPEVVRRLAAASKGTKEQLAPCKLEEGGAQVPLACGDVQIGSWRTGASGQLEVNVDAAMSAAQKAALLKHIAAFVEKKVLLLPNKSTAPSIEVAP